jgi:glycosyltransferase involved in cell wall biosynthesis
LGVRILHVVTAFPRTPDDVITPWLVELLRRLRASGFDIEVFTSAYRGGGPRAFEGIPVHRFRYFPSRWEDLTHDEAVPDRMKRSWLYRFMAVCYVAGGAFAIWRLCRRRGYDVVHVHWALPHALFGWVARWACGARTVTTFHGVELRWRAAPRGPWHWFLARAARSTDRAVAISRHTAEAVRRLGRADVQVIPYAVGVSGEAPGEPRSPGAVFAVLFVGRLVERKGVHVLIEALRHLPADVIPGRLVVVGEGPELDSLRRLTRQLGLSEQVTFTGRVPDEALRQAYRSADVVVLPAVVDQRGDTEGLGVVLLEAMQHRVPVVASDIGGIPDIIEHETSGLLVPPGDPVALAAALARLARDHPFAERLAQAGYRRVTRNFGWPAIVARWKELYDGLAGAPRAHRTAS